MTSSSDLPNGEYGRGGSPLVRCVQSAVAVCSRAPHSFIALLGRFSIAAPMAALAEHALPVLILLGLATRFSALGLLVMTLVIQLFVYPGAYPTHGVWATVLLYLVARGPGVVSFDHLVAGRYRQG